MKRIEVNQKSSSGIKPFLDQAFERGLVNNGDIFLLDKVSETRTKAGWVLHCSDFMVHLYKSSPLVDVILETLEELCLENPARGLGLEIAEEESEGFFLTLTETYEYMWVRQKKFGGLSAFIRSSPRKAGNRGKGSK